MAALLVILTAACSSVRSPPGAANFPAKIGGFERADETIQGRSGVTSAYVMTRGDETVIATVQRRAARASTSLMPELDLGRGDAQAILATEIDRSIQQVHRFYPHASAGAVGNFLVLRDGTTRPGRRVTLEYRAEDMDTPMHVIINLICCTRANEVVEIRFRQPISVEFSAEEAMFLRDFPWSQADLTP